MQRNQPLSSTNIQEIQGRRYSRSIQRGGYWVWGQSQILTRRPPKEVSFLADKLSLLWARKNELSVIVAVASHHWIGRISLFPIAYFCTTKPSQGLSCESVPDLNYIFESLARVYRWDVRHTSILWDRKSVRFDINIAIATLVWFNNLNKMP